MKKRVAAPIDPARSTRCGDTSAAHRTRSCRRCRQIANASDHAKYGKRRRQRSAAAPEAVRLELSERRRLLARVRARVRRAAAARACAECSAVASLRLVVVDDEFYALACRAHASLVTRNLTLAQMRAAEEEYDRRQRLAVATEQAASAGWKIADPSSYAGKREWFLAEFPKLDEATRAALESLAARRMPGAVISKDAPLFKSALIGVFEMYSRGQVTLPAQG